MNLAQSCVQMKITNYYCKGELSKTEWTDRVLRNCIYECIGSIQGCGAVTFLVGSGSGSGSGEAIRLRLRLRAKCTGSGGSGSGSGSDDQALI